MCNRGGDTDVVPLFAALPDLRGFSQGEGGLFMGNSADSTIVHLLIRADSGYGRNDLYVGNGDSGMILMLCERAA